MLERTLPVSEHKLIVACIPAYNEDRTLPSVIIKAQKYVDEVLVYDDGSEDMTSEVASALKAYVISSKKNQGKGVALKHLFQHALNIGADVTVTLDSDGQHDPNEIPLLIEPVLNGEADIALGSRYVDGAWTDAPLYRRFGLRIINALSGGGTVKDTQSGYRAYSKRALEAMLSCEVEGYGTESEQLAIAKEHNLKIKEVPVTVLYDGLAQTSKKSPLRHGLELIDTIAKLTVHRRPLLVLGVPGISLFSAGLILGGYLLLIFNQTRYFSIPLAIVCLGVTIGGMFLAMTSLILYSIKNNKENKG